MPRSSPTSSDATSISNPDPTPDHSGIVLAPRSRPGPGGDSAWTVPDLVLRVQDRIVDRSGASRPPRFHAFDRPVLRIGAAPWSDLVMDHDPAWANRHLYWHIDARGLYAIDLRGRAETRFPRTATRSRPGPRAGWLRVGDALDVGPDRLEVLHLQPWGDPAGIGGDPVGTWAGPEEPDLLGSAVAGLVELVLQGPGGDPGLRMTSQLGFLGSDRSCAISVPEPGIGRLHASLFRTATAAYLIRMTGRPIRAEGREVGDWVRLGDGMDLILGTRSFQVRLDPPGTRPGADLPVLAQPQFDPDLAGTGAGSSASDSSSQAELGRLTPALVQALVPTLAQVLGQQQARMIQRLADRQDRFEAKLRADLVRMHRWQREQFTAVKRSLEQIERVQEELAQIRRQLARAGSDPNRNPAAASAAPAVPHRVALAQRSPGSPGQSGQPAPAPSPFPVTAATTPSSTAEHSTPWLLAQAEQLESQNRRNLQGLLGLLNRSMAGGKTRPEPEPEPGDRDGDD